MFVNIGFIKTFLSTFPMPILIYGLPGSRICSKVFARTVLFSYKIDDSISIASIRDGSAVT
jgi:hypothetical protein